MRPSFINQSDARSFFMSLDSPTYRRRSRTNNSTTSHIYQISPIDYYYFFNFQISNLMNKSTYLTALILGLITLTSTIDPIVAQEAKCTSLSDSTVCTPWKGQSFNLQYKSYYNFSGEPDFNKFISSRSPNNKEYVAFFKKQYNCPNWDGTGLRYYMSFFCGMFAFTSKSTCDTKIQICKSTCMETKLSMEAIFNNPAFCTQGVNRTNVLKPIESVCEAAADGPDCAQFITAESKNCGFGNYESAKKFCTGKDDKCCSALEATASSAESDSNLKIIIGSVIGGAVLLFVLIFLIISCVKRRRNRIAGGGGSVASNMERNSFAPKSPAMHDAVEVRYNFVPNLSDELGLSKY